MTTDELLALLEERNLRVVYRSTQPRLLGSSVAITPKLMRVVKLHKDEIMKRLPPESNQDPTDKDYEPTADDLYIWNTLKLCDHQAVLFALG